MTTLQTLLVLTALVSAAIILNDIIITAQPTDGLSGRTIWQLIAIIVICLIALPAAACDEDDLTDYSTRHLLVVCTPGAGGYAQNPYYTGNEKCGEVK